MSNRNSSESDRVVKAPVASFTKEFEAGVAHALDELPSGARRTFALRLGKSAAWVSRLVDLDDPTRMHASLIGKALNALGTVEPLAGVLDGVKIGGVEYELTPKAKRVRGTDIQRASMMLAQSVGGYLGGLAEALADGKLSADERRTLRRELGEHQRAVTDLLLSLEGE